MFAFGIGSGFEISLVELGLTWWLQSGVLIVIGLSAAALVKDRGSAAQSAIYRATLLGVICCPVLTMILSTSGASLFSLDLKTRPGNNAVDLDDGAIQPRSSQVTAGVESVASSSGQRPLGGPGAGDPLSIQPAEFAYAPSHDLSGSTAASVSSTQRRSAPRTVKESSRTSWIALATVALWLLGMIALATRLLSDVIHSHRLRATSGDPEPFAQQMCEEVAGRLGVSPPIVRVCPFLNSPCLYGHWRPAVFLPEETPSSSYREVFLHELAHLRRDDWLWNLLGRVIQAMLWTQPLLWKLLRRNSAVAEEVCDDYVLTYGGNREGYLERLVEIAESTLPRSRSVGVAMVSFQSTLGQRAKRILDTTREISTTAGYRFAGAAVLAMFVLSMSVGLFSVGQSSEVVAQTVADQTENAPDGAESNPVEPTESPKPVPGTVLRRDGSPTNETAARSPYVYEGLVLAANGKPAVGAEIYHLFWYSTPLKNLPTKPSAITGADGRFRCESLASLDATYGGGMLVVKHKGHAIAWASATALETTGRLQAEFEKSLWYPRYKEMIATDSGPIRLLPDDVIVTGRVVDLEGEGVAGATISVEALSTGIDGTLTEWEELADTTAGTIPSLQRTIRRTISGPRVSSLFPALKTDQDGRFSISGIGKDRIAKLVIRGKNIEAILAFARTNNGPKREIGINATSSYWNHKYFGTKLTLVASPSRPIIGKITDAKSGKPIAGAVLTSYESYRQERVGDKTVKTHVGSSEVIAISDAEGNYRLDGLPPANRTPIQVAIEDGQYVPREISLDTRGPSLDPINHDLQMSEGIVVSGKVTDAISGKGVQGRFKYLPSPRESVSELSFHRDIGNSDSDGRFKLIVPRDKGSLCFGALDRDAFSLVSTPKHQRSRVSLYPSGREFNWVQAIAATPNQTSLNFHLTLTPEMRLTGSAIAPDGTKLRDILFVGRSPQFPRWYPSPNGELEVLGLKDGKSRKLAVFNREANLVGSLTLENDHDGEFEIKMEPWASVKGTIVDEEGNPIAGVRILSSLNKPTVFASPAEAMEQDFSKLPLPLPPHDELGNANHFTDDDGRFEIIGMIPHYVYKLTVTGGMSIRQLDPTVASRLELDSGENRDLGKIVLKELQRQP